MTFIIATLLIIFGIMIFSFTSSNIILIIFFAIPFTKKLERLSILKSNTIIKKYLITLVIQIVILITPIIIVFTYFNYGPHISLLIGYFFGLVAMFEHILRKKMVLNINTFSEYFENNKNFFWEEFILKYYEDKEKIFNFIVSVVNKNEQKEYERYNKNREKDR